MSSALKFFCLFFIVFSGIQLTAQDSADPVLLKVGDEETKVSDFQAVYKKNNQEVSQQSLEDYLELYIKFRLKVLDAESQGLDTSRKFKRELAGYRSQLAQPYLSDNQVTEELIKEAYERMQYEVKASHIMVVLDKNASPADTAAAFKRIKAIQKRLSNGEDFAKVAKEASEDPSAKENDGNLGYFSALYMVYPFENAVYKMKVGEISGIVRSRFGYHIVRLEDKIPNRGEITVAHIMTRIPKEANEAQIEASRMKINELYEKLEGGENFEDLARNFSEDQTSAARGGVLPPFSAGKMVTSFENAAFALQNDGDISKPVRTPFGFHIVKRVRVKPIGSFEEMKPELTQRISRDSRSKLSKESFIKSMKAEYNFKEYPKARKAFYTKIDASFFTREWTADKAAGMNAKLFEFGDTSVTQLDFAGYLEPRQPNNPDLDKQTHLDRMYNIYVEKTITEYENYRLEKKYPEFRLLMNEYHDGILLFDLTDDMVWSKAVRDTTGLEAFYEEHKNEYMWGERLHANIYSCKDEATANSVRKLVKGKKKKGYSNADILKMTNTDSQLNLELDSAKFSKGEQPIVDKVEWSKGISDNISLENRVYVVEVLDVIPAEPKKLSEVRGFITSAYQNHLEEQWIAELREQYPVEVHKEHLSAIK